MPFPVVGAVQLAAHLEAGGVGLMPTDTLPALVAKPEAAGQIWTLKERPSEKPLILMGADLEALLPVLGHPWHEDWLTLARCGWPGALTLVLPATGTIVENLHPGGTSLGLRVPACPQALELLQLSGPLATTSANPSGVASATTAQEAAHWFPGLPLLAPLPWPFCGGIASTVLAWNESTNSLQGDGSWQLIRAGAFLLPRECF